MVHKKDLFWILLHVECLHEHRLPRVDTIGEIVPHVVLTAIGIEVDR